MENYNELKLTNEKNVISRTFSYDFNTGIFSFVNKYREIDEDLNLLFSPHFSSLPDLKSRLENEIFLLQNKNGEFSFEINYYSKEYGLRYYLVKGNNLVDSNVVLGVIYDVTYEYDLLEKLAQAERLRTLGELSSGIAHDFNNNLMVVSGASELLLLGELNEKQKDYVNKIFAACKRSANLVRKLLNFSHTNDSETTFDLVDVVKNCNDIINYTTKKKANIHFITGLNSAYIKGNVSLATNAIINLVKNGIEASKINCDIYLSLSLVKVNEIPKNSVLNNDVSGYFYKLDIKDFGSGISEDNLSKIFNPFYSTKDISEGTGLGLSTVLSTVKSFDGILTLDSKEKIGTTFSIYFRKMEDVG